MDDGIDNASVYISIPNEIKVGTNDFIVEYLNMETTSTIEAVDVTPVKFEITQIKPIEDIDIFEAINDGYFECKITYSDDSVIKYYLFELRAGGITGGLGIIKGNYTHNFSFIHEGISDSEYYTHKETDGCAITFELCKSGLVSNLVVDNKQFEHKHTPVIDEAVPATCKKSGLTEGSH